MASSRPVVSDAMRSLPRIRGLGCSCIFRLIFCIRINLLGNEGLQNFALCVANVLEGKPSPIHFAVGSYPKHSYQHIP